MEKEGLIVVGSTLPIWMAIMLAGTVTMAAVGYCNYYVPRDQKIKAKYFRDHHETLIGQDSSIYFGRRVDEIVYLVIAIAIVLLATIFFFLETYQEIREKVLSLGVLGLLVGVLVFLFVFFVVVVFLVMVAIASENEAVKGLQKYYWGHYQVPLLDASKIEPFVRKYPR